MAKAPQIRIAKEVLDLALDVILLYGGSEITASVRRGSLVRHRLVRRNCVSQ
jgi:hypothetical protein